MRPSRCLELPVPFASRNLSLGVWENYLLEHQNSVASVLSNSVEVMAKTALVCGFKNT